MRRGKYNTKQKDNILHIIRHMNREFMVKDVFDQVSSVSLTTIYRFIDQLEKEGIIQKNISSVGKTTYQYIEKCDCDHFYLRCDQCGKIIHIECDFVNDLEKHIRKDHHFCLNRDHIIMSGVCHDCQKKEGNARC